MTTDPPCTWAQAIKDDNLQEVEDLSEDITDSVNDDDVGISAPALAFALISELQVKCATHDDARATFEALVIEMRTWLEAGLEDERKRDFH